MGPPLALNRPFFPDPENRKFPLRTPEKRKARFRGLLV